jgi:hypothetical protein
MNHLLKQLKDIRAEGCVSLCLNTHRTKPGYLKDAILLKNLLREAEKKLPDVLDKRKAKKLIERMNTLAESIDHSHNLESLIIFINEEVAEYIRLPIEVTDRAVVDNTFATRDLVRALHRQAEYYVLVISRNQARLIEAANDRLIGEAGPPFPVQNKSLYATDKLSLSMARGTDNLIEEFFNQVDKVVQEQTKHNPMPIILVTEERNRFHYEKVTDKNKLIGHLNQNRDAEKAQNIVRDAWKIVKEVNEKRIRQRKEELREAVARQNFLTDLSEIWLAVNEGRGKTVFVSADYFQPARIVNGRVILAEELPVDTPGFVDDIVDEIIEINLKHGGDTVFLPGSQMEKFGGVALVTRY